MTRGTPKTVHTLKVTLRHVKPPVWRRILVRSETRLSAVANLTILAMGWDGYHLHSFETPDRTRYGIPDRDDLPMFGFGRPTLDESKHKLGDVLPAVGSKLRFDYDFGDGWEHDLVVEAIGRPESASTYPLCVAGKRACPPEDCGGPWGYQEMLEALADTKHERHAELVEWIGDEFDPAEFDADEVTELMQSVRPGDRW